MRSSRQTGKRFLTALSMFLSAASVAAAGTVTSFDPNWKFLKEDAAGAEQSSFSDSAWRSVDVPHDWSIEGPYDQAAPTRGSGGSLPAGIGWYRKTFTLPQADSGKRFFIDFEGVMANSDVWINGVHLGKRPFGYISFRYELTGHLNFGEGKTNVLAVRADNSPQPASRWYTGAGIYRHVQLVSSDPVHVDQWGTFITTPQVSKESATVNVSSTVINQSDQAKEVVIQTTLIGPDGQKITSTDSAPQSIPAGKSVEFKQDVKVANPKIWDIESPNLYRAVVAVKTGGKTVDEDTNTVGIRSFEFKSDTGFWLNGKNFKLLGVCLHQDGGAFGSAVPTGVWERRLNALRDMGVNAIRCSHCPPDPAFLELCDRMGFLVMDETFDCWTVAKNPNDYHLYFNEWHLTDLRDMVRRDRNHPSIILYSAGNEIHDTPRAEMAKAILKPMVEEFHKWDPTRPVTQALFRPNSDGDGGAYKNGLADMLDVIGTNYRDKELLAAWKDKPSRKIIGTEQGQTRDTWLDLRDNPQHAGQFIWVGIDYLGESPWPETTYYNGLLDRLGQFKAQGWERQAWWSTKPMVKIVRAEPPAGGRGARRGEAPASQAVPDGGFGDAGADAPRGGRRGAAPAAPVARGGPVSNWTLRDGATPGQSNVTVYSNCDEVELFLNDRSLGMKPKNANDASRTWNLAYEAGTLKAVGKNAGKVVATDELRTASKAAKIQLSIDSTRITPTFDDVAFVTASVVDEAGVVQPNSDARVSFKVTGPGVVAAVDNASLIDHDPYQAADRKAYQGKAVAIIKANAASGQITITASADGLQGSSVTINASPAAK